jgi:hypothetical protein
MSFSFDPAAVILQRQPRAFAPLEPYLIIASAPMAAPRSRSEDDPDTMSNDCEESHQDEQQATLEDMPAEMINAIFSYLRPHDLTKLAQVSKKYREITQSSLWRSIELHRQDAHHEAFGLSTQKNICRSYLDDQLHNPWAYRVPGGADLVFDHRNAKFGTAVRKLFRSAGKSRAWIRLAPFVQHLCLTVTHKSPPQIWDMILSLSNLATLEVIGEFSASNEGPPGATNLREPKAQKIRDVRLRGYIPAQFVSQLWKASASSVICLDLGALEPPKLHDAEGEELEWQQELGHPLYVAPRGLLCLGEDNAPSFSSLTHLLLCKRGSFDGPPDMSEDEDFEIREDDAHEVKQLKEWAALLSSVRSTIVELTLEQRPVYLEYLLYTEMEISPDDTTSFCPMLHSFDSLFYRHILKSVFDDGKAWPKFEKLTLRGINLIEFEKEAGETLDVFTKRALPGVTVKNIPGNYMFFNTRKGTIMNQHGADGLKTHIGPSNGNNEWDDLWYMFD